MNPKSRTRAAEIESALIEYHRTRQPLPGIQSAVRMRSFVQQLLDSTRRTEYVRTVLSRELSPYRADPKSQLFDPILGSIVSARAGRIEEAFWLTFLATHFGRSSSSGWGLCRAVYGRLGTGVISDWDRTRQNVQELCQWIVANAILIRTGPPALKFGNHRKYESLEDKGSRGTPVTIRTYVEWVERTGSHVQMIADAVKLSKGDPHVAFHQLYKSMSAVASFGRLAKFDYLSMLGKLRLAPIAAGSTYLGSSTGPLAGAALLFSANADTKYVPSIMDRGLRDLGDALLVTMQDLEDALCNWQKSPDAYRRFAG